MQRKLPTSPYLRAQHHAEAFSARSRAFIIFTAGRNTDYSLSLGAGYRALAPPLFMRELLPLALSRICIRARARPSLWPIGAGYEF